MVTNLFRMEIATRDALLVWEGLGGSYGDEKLSLYRRNPSGGPPEERVETFVEPKSWEREWEHFYSRVTGHSTDLRSSIEESLNHFSILERFHQEGVWTG